MLSLSLSLPLITDSEGHSPFVTQESPDLRRLTVTQHVNQRDPGSVVRVGDRRDLSPKFQRETRVLTAGPGGLFVDRQTVRTSVMGVHLLECFTEVQF